VALTKDGLRALVALQEKDKVLDARQKEVDAVPPKLAALKAEYDKQGREPSNLRYGYVAEPVSDFSVFG